MRGSVSHSSRRVKWNKILNLFLRHLIGMHACDAYDASVVSTRQHMGMETVLQDTRKFFWNDDGKKLTKSIEIQISNEFCSNTPLRSSTHPSFSTSVSVAGRTHNHHGGDCHHRGDDGWETAEYDVA